MKRIIKELYPYVIILVIVILIRTFIATPVRVDGDSMRKNLNHGDILLLYKLSDIKRYDIVVLKDKDSGEDIVKRLYGLPGETIKIEDNTIYINGNVIEDKYRYGDTEDVDEVTLKEDEYFVLGDNRLISKDSHIFGPVNKKQISGKVVFRLFPFNKLGSI